jgi:DNA-binding MarR family transcriptional regulator
VTSKAGLAAWSELNDRQRGVLAVVYELDQLAEAAHRGAGAAGQYDRRPASIWRAVDFAHDPSLRSVVGWTQMQLMLEQRGWDNQGNGSTVAALETRGLLTRSSRPTTIGRMVTVALTRAGRAAALAGTSTASASTARARKAKPLGARSWEVLALLWAADQRGEPLRWGYSRTIELSLIERHDPPLAADAGSGYVITDQGREFYRDRYTLHVAAYPEVRADHPDGAAAEPWPAAADEVLAAHRDYYQGLCAAWTAATADQRAAETEAAAPPAVLATVVPAEVRAHAEQRHQLWCETARTRAELAAAHAHDLAGRVDHAARGYALAALAAFAAATAGADPLAVLAPPVDATDDWDAQRLEGPAQTGIHAIDAEARALRAAAAGVPAARRGPAPRRRRVPRTDALATTLPPVPGAAMVALAQFFHAPTCARARSPAGCTPQRCNPSPRTRVLRAP